MKFILGFFFVNSNFFIEKNIFLTKIIQMWSFYTEIRFWKNVFSDLTVWIHVLTLCYIEISSVNSHFYVFHLKFSFTFSTDVEFSLDFNSCVAFQQCFARMLFITDNFAKNYPKGLSLKFQGATFDTVEISGNKILIGSLTESELDMTHIIWPFLRILAIKWESVPW